MKRITALILTLSALLFNGYTVQSPEYKRQTKPGEYISVLFNKKKITSEKFTGAVSQEKFDISLEYTDDYAFTLYKEKGENFTVLNLADIHFSDFGYRVLFSLHTESLIRKLVKETEPDLILLSGDFVCSDSEYYSIRRLTDLMDSLGVPFAPIFGNHDREGNCDENYLAECLMQSPLCLFKKNDPEMGCGNYVINIKEKSKANEGAEETEKTVETIIMLDSHSSQPNEKQREWYKWVCEGTKRLYGGESEIMCSMHVPLPEYETAYNLAFENDESKALYKALGEKNEKICCERDENSKEKSNGFFDTAKECGTKYIFCSHDHMNDFSLEYEGVRLTYCMKIGKASGYQPGFDGGTVIEIGENGLTSFTHKTIRLSSFVDIEKFGVEE